MQLPVIETNAQAIFPLPDVQLVVPSPRMREVGHRHTNCDARPTTDLSAVLAQAGNRQPENWKQGPITCFGLSLSEWTDQKWRTVRLLQPEDRQEILLREVLRDELP